MLDQPFQWSDGELDGLARGSDPAALAVALRRLRQRVYLHVLLRDLTGRADLNEVCATMTRLAEIAIAAAVDAHSNWLAAIHGEPLGADSGAPEQLIVVAMGKLGGGELNVSSDVDLVFVYPEDGDTRGPKVLANQDFFDRLGRRVVAALGRALAGRLCVPHRHATASVRRRGSAGLVVRCARTVPDRAGPHLGALRVAQGARADRRRAPASWSSWSPLSSIENIWTTTRTKACATCIARFANRAGAATMRATSSSGPAAFAKSNSSSRRCSWCAAGASRRFVFAARLPALAALRVRGLLPAAAADELVDAYVFLRKVEHRLQYRDDAQTHDLPHDDADRAALAAAMACSDAAAFDRLLDRHRNNVDRHFDALFSAADGGAERDPLAVVWIAPAPEDAHLAALAAAGYDDPRALIVELARVRKSPRYLQLPTASRARFDALVPQLLRAAAATSAPQTVFERLLALLETISRRSAYLALAGRASAGAAAPRAADGRELVGRRLPDAASDAAGRAAGQPCASDRARLECVAQRARCAACRAPG